MPPHPERTLGHSTRSDQEVLASENQQGVRLESMETSRAAIRNPALRALADIRQFSVPWTCPLSRSFRWGWERAPFGGSRPHFLPHCDAKVTIPPQERVTFHPDSNGGRKHACSNHLRPCDYCYCWR